MSASQSPFQMKEPCISRFLEGVEISAGVADDFADEFH